MVGSRSKGGSYEDSDGINEQTYEAGYQRGLDHAERKLKGQIAFLLKEREGFVEDIRQLQEEVAHLRRVTSDTGAIAP